MVPLTRYFWLAIFWLGFVVPAPLSAQTAAPSAPLVLAQAQGPVIKAPNRLETDQETVDFVGEVESASDVILTLNDQPLAIARDGTFHVKQVVPLGKSTLVLFAEDPFGNIAGLKVLVERIRPQEPETYGSYYGLVIGINDYNHLKPLQTAIRDAEAIATVLTSRYNFRVETLINATRSEIVKAISDFRARLGEGDNLLIYYAGHGNLDVEGDEGYWLPVDAESDNPAEWLSLGIITSQLKAIRAKHVMVVADSCYSGKLTRDIGASLPTGGENNAWLDRMIQRRSRTALTSGGLEPVADAGRDGHSVFGYAVLDALSSNDGIITGQQLFSKIKNPIIVNADQTPEYADIRRAGHGGGDFVLIPAGATVAAADADTAAHRGLSPGVSARPHEGTIELTFWQTIQDSQNPADFEAYLRKYPYGQFAQLARNKMNAVKPPPAPEPQKQARLIEKAPPEPPATPPVPETMYGAVYFGDDDEFGISSGVPGAEAAKKAALENCRAKTSGRKLSTVFSTCVAVAIAEKRKRGTLASAEASTRRAAANMARKLCVQKLIRKVGRATVEFAGIGCRTKQSVCADPAYAGGPAY